MKKLATALRPQRTKHRGRASRGVVDIDRLYDGIFDRIMWILGRRNIFFIGDLHLDHANIIRYCRRPFRTIQEMNYKLVTNWNRSVRKRDTVFFLGDMAYGRGNRGPDYWLRRLNGRIYYLRGNHDRSGLYRRYSSLIVKYRDMKFYLVHNPMHAPQNRDGWLIHGHVHNNSPAFPLVHPRNRTVNVSVELTGYRPLPLRNLLQLMQRGTVVKRLT